MSDLSGIKPGRLIGDQPANEADHFFVCEACGQAVDMRDLAEVFRHEDWFSPTHEARTVS